MGNNELRRAVRAMTAMIQNGEWAEHVSKDTDAMALEAAITGLHNDLFEAQSAPVDALPEYEDIVDKLAEGGTLTALEKFILDNEPAGCDDETAFRTGLLALVRATPRVEAKPLTGDEAYMERVRLNARGISVDAADFELGMRFAERHHGIGTQPEADKGVSNGGL